MLDAGAQEIDPMALVAFRVLVGAITAVVIARDQKVPWPRWSCPLGVWIEFKTGCHSDCVFPDSRQG